MNQSVGKTERDISTVIDDLDADVLTMSSYARIFDELLKRYLLPLPVVDIVEAFICEKDDCKVDVSQYPDRNVSDRSKPCWVDGKLITVRVPVSGGSCLVVRKPNGPNGLSGQLHVAQTHMDIRYLRPFPIDEELLNRDIQNDLRAIKANMGFATSDIDRFNRDLPDLIESKLKQRLTSIGLSKQSLAGLSLPVRLQESSSNIDTKKKGTGKLAIRHKGEAAMPKMTVAANDAQQRIEKQLESGNLIRNRSFLSESDVDQALNDTERWARYTHTVLTQMFDSNAIAEEFTKWFTDGFDRDIGVGYMDPTLNQSIQFLLDILDPKLNRLRSIYERLELFDQSVAATVVPTISYAGGFQYDVFICHASEDKKDVAERLANELTSLGYSVWYDAMTLKIGDSLRRKIDEGLRESRFGLVLLSKAFFGKQWTQWELDGLTEKEMRAGKTVILPIWHNVTHSEVLEFSPSLANKLAGNTMNWPKLLSDIVDVLGPSVKRLAESV